jgi:transcriptional regulator with XRE-family HTH domain
LRPINVDRLAVAIQLRGLKLEELATLADVSPGTVSKALAGRPIRASPLRALAKALTEAPVVDGAELLIDEAVSA